MFYSMVQKGDIIYESEQKTIGGYTGHISIVEGKYYDSDTGRYFVRVIEAINVGICRGIMDDTRIAARNAKIYRARAYTSTSVNTAVSFCVTQLGKQFITTEDVWRYGLTHHTSPSTPRWYCSELVWASYMSAGINIEASLLSEPGVTPRDITLNNSDKAIEVYNYAANITPHKTLAANFQGDTKTDLLNIVHLGGNRTVFAVQTSSGSPLFPPWQIFRDDSGFNATNAGQRIVADDFNGDGWYDICALYDNGNNNLHFAVYINNKNSTFTWVNGGTWSASVSGIGDRFVAGDFDGNGKCDVAVMYDYGTSGNTALFMWRSNCSGNTFNGFYGNSNWHTWPAGAYDATNGVKSRFVAGDFNGDGKCDLSAMYQYGSGKVNWFVYTSTSSTFNGSASWNEWPAGHYAAEKINGRIAVSDLNKDGKDDIAVMYDYSNDNASIFVYTPNNTKNGFNSRTLQQWASAGSYSASRVTNRFVAGRFRGGTNYGETAVNYKYPTIGIAWMYRTETDGSGTSGGTMIKPNVVHQQW